MRKRVIEQYSSSEDEDSNNNGEKIDAPYIQKVRKIKRNSGKRYCSQTGNIVHEKFSKTKIVVVRMLAQKLTIKKKKERIFLRSFGVWQILTNKMYYFTKLSSAKL